MCVKNTQHPLYENQHPLSTLYTIPIPPAATPSHHPSNRPPCTRKAPTSNFNAVLPASTSPSGHGILFLTPSLSALTTSKPTQPPPTPPDAHTNTPMPP